MSSFLPMQGSFLFGKDLVKMADCVYTTFNMCEGRFLKRQVWQVCRETRSCFSKYCIKKVSFWLQYRNFGYCIGNRTVQLHKLRGNSLGMYLKRLKEYIIIFGDFFGWWKSKQKRPQEVANEDKVLQSEWLKRKISFNTSNICPEIDLEVSLCWFVLKMWTVH